MKITNYQLLNDRVIIYLNTGSYLTIYFNENSGKAYFRYKIDTISKIKHPGIFIGIDGNRKEYFIHNHYQVGTAALVTSDEFDKGNTIFLYEEKCSNDPMTVIRKAFEHLMRGEHYKFYTYNCQTMVNDACDNQRRSQAAENWTAGIALAGVALLFVTLFGGSKK